MSRSVRDLGVDNRNSDLLEMGTPNTAAIDPEEEIKTNRMIEERKQTISRFSNLTDQVQ